MTDTDKRALFVSIEKLLKLQARDYEQRIAEERWRVELRAREMESARERERLRRDILDTLSEIRKQLGLPDLSPPPPSEAAPGSEEPLGPLFGAFNELFKDFFETRSSSV